MDIRRYGYIRTSSKDQNEQRQLDAMKAAGINERDIFIDKVSGKDFDREQYQLLKHCLRRGDILYLHSLDRFGRSKDEIQNEWQDITKDIQADIVVMDMPLLDTTKYRDSLGTFISDLVLQILSWIAEDERQRIRHRQREGIASALNNGTTFGRPKADITDSFVVAYNRWRAGEITATTAMELSGTKRTTFYKLVKEYEERQR
jgi:DNA invertase Pin-like site-specific DNA recombinase